MHKLMRYIKGYEKQALLAPLFKMLEACFELFVPLVIASIIDTGIKNGDAAFIWTRCGLLVLLAILLVGGAVLGAALGGSSSHCDDDDYNHNRYCCP